jgi:hypothetical protein
MSEPESSFVEALSRSRRKALSVCSGAWRSRTAFSGRLILGLFAGDFAFSQIFTSDPSVVNYGCRCGGSGIRTRRRLPRHPNLNRGRFANTESLRGIKMWVRRAEVANTRPDDFEAGWSGVGGRIPALAGSPFVRKASHAGLAMNGSWDAPYRAREVCSDAVISGRRGHRHQASSDAACGALSRSAWSARSASQPRTVDGADDVKNGAEPQLRSGPGKASLAEDDARCRSRLYRAKRRQIPCSCPEKAALSCVGPNETPTCLEGILAPSSQCRI